MKKDFEEKIEEVAGDILKRYRLELAGILKTSKAQGKTTIDDAIGILEMGSESKEPTIADTIKECPICHTTTWLSVKCPCHRVCKNGDKFRREGW